MIEKKLSDFTPEELATLPWWWSMTLEQLVEAYRAEGGVLTPADVEMLSKSCVEISMEEVLREIEETQRQYDLGKT